MKIKIYSLNKEEIVDLLSTALYGNPRLSVDNSTEEYKQADGDTIEEKLADMLLKGQAVYLIDMYENELLDMNLDRLCYGLSKFIENGGSANIDDYDLIDGDSVLQYTMFGEVIWAN